MDHTFAENISLYQEGDKVSSIENSYNEINPLNVIKTENEEVQDNGELASTVEFDGNNDRNLDTPPTLKIMESEINNLNDAGEQESTVIIEPVDRTFNDNLTPNEPIDHTFDEHPVEESVNRDTESVLESLNNFDEVNPLNIVKTENEVVQSAEEINDYVEQDNTVVSVANNVQDHDIEIEDQHDEVGTVDEIAESPVVSDNIVESKPRINNNNEDDEGDTSNIAENGQGNDSSAPEMAIPRSRNLYIPPVQDARTFLITGRNDGASSHFIPIFRQNSKDLSKAVEQDDVVPFAFRGEQKAETSSESQAAFKQAVNAIPNEEHRLSMQDIVTRHSTANDEIIVLDSDNEDDFNQLAKEIVLDTDATSEDPVPVKVHPSLTKILKKHQTQGISFLYKCLFGKIADISMKRHTGAEFKKWLTELDRTLDTIEVSELQTANSWATREKILKKWAKARSSVVIMSYELFKSSFKFLDPHLLTSPGPDIVVFDEAHVLNKNEKTQIFEAVRKIKTLRRISLTGTPIQNNLQEYYHMVDFVAPGILGTLKNFKKDFDEKIRAGTTKEANPNDAELMKKKALILFKQLDMVMDRQNFSVLAKILPKKTEWVIYVRLSEVQQKLYQHFVNLRKKSTNMLAQQRAFADEHTLYRIGLYPYWVKICDENEKKKNDKAKMGDWYSQILKSYKCKENDYEMGNKLVLFLQLLKWFEKLGEKTIVYTYYVEVIDVLMKLLESKAATWFSDGHPAKNSDSTWSWKRNKDFYVIQGDTPKPKRHELIQTFNDSNNKRGRLFIMSDAGSMGTNMTGATRFIVFESRHNPSTEIQAIFRAYRIGQTKLVHVYRLVAQGTMEDCIFKRQIVKQQTAARVLDNEGVSRTIQKSDIDELLRFCPAPADMDYAKQPDYAPTGDEEFDAFCLAHREMIVEVRNHDSLIAFNEEEKLAVDVCKFFNVH
uniref:Uncharacterized protein n=1 Tax=Panagrolaimus davidi TaxID=227884 RepID=A0A914Q947_9BILA